MTNNKVKSKYEPPRAVDLSDFSVHGQTSTGVCKSGSAPFYSCVEGPDFLGACDPTGATPDTSECVAGGYHLTPSCAPGNDAATVCLSGSGQQ